MPTLLGTVAASLQVGGIIETLIWDSDFSEYAGTNVSFLPETGWAANDWDDGGHTYDSTWFTTNSGGLAYLHCGNSSQLHYQMGYPDHQVEADLVAQTSFVAGIIVGQDSGDTLHYVGFELVRLPAPENKLVGYVRWSGGEDTFFVNLAAGLVPGTTYTLKMRMIDNFVTLYLDDDVVAGYQLSTAQAADINGNSRAGVVTFSGAPHFDRVELRDLQQFGTPTVPEAPINVVGTPSVNSVGLTWIPLTPGITDYVVQYALASAPTTWTTFSEGVSASPSATVTGLTGGTAYVFHVAAVTAVGQGPYSATSASVTPLTSGPPTTDLILHLEADALALSNGDPVSTWTATVGSSPTRSGTSRPTYIASGLNGLPTVRFDGTDDYMDIPSGFSTWTAGFTWIFVVTPTSVSGNSQFISFNNTGSSTMVFTRASATGGNHVFNGSGAVRYGNSSAAMFAINTPVVATLMNPAGSANTAVTATYYKNNTAWGTADSYVPPVSTKTPNTLGISMYGPEYWIGDMSEVLIYNRALSGAEMTTVHTYLNTKYGL